MSRFQVERAYVGYNAFDPDNDDAGPDSPVGWGLTPKAAVRDLEDKLGEGPDPDRLREDRQDLEAAQ